SYPCFPGNNNTHWSVRTPARPVHLLFSSARCFPSLPLPLLLIVASLNTFFGLLNTWCSASQLLLALTQTATNWLS
ncbi:unnamed protein product, partial [Hymenolepis diminuta]